MSIFYKIYFILLFFSVNFSFSQSNIDLKSKQLAAEIAIHNNDINSLKKNIGDVFMVKDKLSTFDILPFYLLRAKYYKAISNNKSAESDIDTVLKYDIKNMEAYLLKISFLKNANNQIQILQNGINVVENKIPLIKQQALIKIGLIAAFWDNAMYNSEPFSVENATKEIYIAKGGCMQLSNIISFDEEAKALYEKKCKIEAIKNF